MVDEIFIGGYGSESEINSGMIRWNQQEMLDLCDDEGLLSLFQRYVTWFTPRDKMKFEREVEAEIALDDLLSS